MRRMKGCLVLCAVLLAMLCPLAGASAQGVVAIVVGEVEAGAFSPPAQWTDSDDAPQVLWAAYPLNTATSMDRMAAALLDFARMPEVGTLILCQAMPGSAQVLAQARELRPDLQLMVLLPQEPAETIGAVSDLVLDFNRIAQAERMMDQMGQSGTNVLLYYSFPRQLAMEGFAAQLEALSAATQAAGISFVQMAASDPSSDRGQQAAQQFMLDELPVVLGRYPEMRVGVFVTDCALQKPVEEMAAVFDMVECLGPCCPDAAVEVLLQTMVEYAAAGQEASLLRSLKRISGQEAALDPYLNDQGEPLEEYYWVSLPGLGFSVGGDES